MSKWLKVVGGTLGMAAGVWLIVTFAWEILYLLKGIVGILLGIIGVVVLFIGITEFRESFKKSTS